MVGGVTSEFRKGTDIDIVHIALESALKLLKDTGFPRNLIDAVIVSSCSPDQYLSSVIAEIVGVTPKISYRIDNLCNSGTNAIISAFSYIASGLCDSALIIGVEKSNTLGKIFSNDFSRGQYNLPIFWGSIFKKIHMKRYGSTEEQICQIPVNNYSKAKKNKNAINRYKSVNLEQVLKSRVLVEPLKLLECCTICEGSSSILLIADEKFSFFKSQITSNKRNCELIPVLIKGIGQQTNCASFSNAIIDIFAVGAARMAAQQAYKMARISPTQVDIAEIHDAFSILEILGYEDLGFVNKGEGGTFVNQNKIAINLRGGIIGCGHPIGVTGVAQTVEMFEQLGKKGRNLKLNKSPHIGVVHNLAAAGTSGTVLVMEG
ncbi:MAG TPA: thiolase family protein [Nitrososphaeraceae archaeon]|nr:thiolase family protein [Nitrososphaeraceae archaeon]